ncbi:MAG: GMC family oxidoreductase [Acetobacteraceae bacterium]|nr:GMC family oxidoreductase [Acetobacteraceae bacterium]
MTTQVDILIIGAGASGAAFAWSMADTRMRILCLEQGDWPNPAEFPATRRDVEQRNGGTFAISPNRRQRATDYPIAEDASCIKVANFNGVGGGTVLYGAHTPRFHPSDFRVRTLDGIADDWPIDYATLAPFYDLNDRMVGVSGLTGDPAYPPYPPQPMPPLPLGRASETLGRGFNKLGWHWWPSDSAIASVEYEGRPACINLGQCTAGCAQGAKGSTDITYWLAAIRAGVELRTRCRVREITTGPDGMATGAIYYDQDGSEHFQPAHVVVMACNGIGTPRILLNSKSEKHPNGLANSSDQLGRNLMFHPYVAIFGYFDKELDGERGPDNAAWSHQFYETDPSRNFLRGFVWEFSRGNGTAATAIDGLESGTIPWGPGHHAAYRKRHRRGTGLGAICEDLPEPHNRVTLDPVLRDSHGIPSPRVTYTLSANSQRMIDFAIARGTEVLRAAGAYEVESEGPLPYGGWHLMGTARMGDNPATSVVNRWGRAHDVRNLFIIDGALFVTSAGVNPTPTIQALALYIADQMKARLGNLFD